MNEYNKETIDKIIKMFTPCDDEIIFGPRDRGMYGIVGREEAFLPIKWLVEDYGFTREEAEWFVKKVQELHGKKSPENKKGLLKAGE